MAPGNKAAGRAGVIDDDGIPTRTTIISITKTESPIEIRRSVCKA